MMREIKTKTALNLKDGPLIWASRACESIMDKYAPSELPPAGRWHYHQGVFLQAVEKVWDITGEKRYFQYIKDYVDLMIDGEGNLEVKEHLDDLMPGQLLLFLDAHTDDTRYRKAAQSLRGLLVTWQTTSDGGFWHKNNYPNQIWLDGIYMEGPFAIKYALRFGEPELFNIVAKQALLMELHMKDEATGLLYHAWDESGQAIWADPVTKCSPEFWGRSVGWYTMALAEMLEMWPNDHLLRDRLTAILRDLLESVRRFQDEREGLWYQVLDKGDRTDNWMELSCSTLFVFAMAKAVKNGYVSADYLSTATKGYQGVLSRIRFDANSRMKVPDICIGTGVGDYQHYVNRDRQTNDLHGVATFVHMCVAMAEVMN